MGGFLFFIGIVWFYAVGPTSSTLAAAAARQLVTIMAHPHPAPERPLVAIDARLLARRATGDRTYWRGLLTGMGQIDPRCGLLLLSDQAAPDDLELPRWARWRQVPGRSSRLWSLVRFPLAARRARAGAMHTQYNLSPLAGRRGITTVHDVSFFVEPRWFRPRDLALLRVGIPSSVRRAAAVITVSETSRREIERFIPAAMGKTQAIPLALNPDLVPLDRKVAKVRAVAAGLPERFFFSIATRWPRKNLGLAVEAAGLLPDSLPHRLVLAGKSGWGERSSNARVLELGYVEDSMLPVLYGAADAHVLPSRHEGFGLTVLEAFACGCPVVCGDAGALPETAGGAARVVDGWSPEAWRDALADLAARPEERERLRELGYDRAAKGSWAETARRTAEVYRDVALRATT